MAERSIWFVSQDETLTGRVRAAAEREGTPVNVVADGSEAVKAATSEQARAVVLDANAGGLDPAQVLRLLRALEAKRFVPVMVLGSVEAARRTELYRLGADDVIETSVSDDELGARLGRCLAERARIDQLAAESADLQKLSITDGLTQLYNHRFFQDRLREEFRRALRYDDPLALIVLDLDHFKTVNDRHGHQVGDQVLRDVAGVLRRSVRETDLVCRYGGEEFCAILPKTHMAGSITVAERMWKEIAAAKVGPGLRITASVGLSGFPGRGVTTAELLLRTADEALYRAKAMGRNKIALHLPPAPDSAAKAG